MQNAMSVDVEDWFQVGAFEGVIARESWPKQTPRIEQNIDQILGLFDDAGVYATFFALSWIAERYPKMMRNIADAGHEIASHGCIHERVHQMQPTEFEMDAARSKAVLEDITGRSVTGYRAPSFSIDARTPWAHEILADKGYSYSSSVVPILHDHYGWPGSPRFAWKPIFGSDFIEIPVTTGTLLGATVPAGGGGFFRLYPYAVSRYFMEQVNREEKPVIFYFHPWEIDPSQPYEARARLSSRLRHYTNLKGMKNKVRRLLGDYSWQRMDNVILTERHRAS